MDAPDRCTRGFLRLALAAIWLNDGTLGDHLDDVRALHEALGPMFADLLALALHAAGLDAEARRGPHVTRARSAPTSSSPSCTSLREWPSSP